jgi:hypothetical protein
VIDATHFTIAASWPGGSPAAAGTVSGGGMAYYDANQTAAAQTALGRPLADFYTQDDDPTVNGSADVNFLANRIKSHIDAIRTTVLAAYPGAKFELLWPYDVNYQSCYYTAALPYPQGGRLNRAVNLPAAYLTQAGSGLDRLKMEGLSWGATYRNLTLAQATIQFPTAVATWPVASCRYLVAWFNGGCAWPQEYLFSLNAGIGLAFWAVDHLTLLGWPLPPLPVNAKQVFIQAA